MGNVVPVRMITLSMLPIALLMGCDAATQYDTGAVVLDISDPEALTHRSATTDSFRNAYDAIKEEDYARAEAFLDRALIEKPKDPYALLAMGSVHERTGRYYSAADFYQSAVWYGDAAAASRLRDGREYAATESLTVGDVARENLTRLGN